MLTICIPNKPFTINHVYINHIIAHFAFHTYIWSIQVNNYSHGLNIFNQLLLFINKSNY